MRDANPIRTLRDYSRPSHEGYRNTIELYEGNNVVPLRSDTIRLGQNRCSFHELRSEDPNHHLSDFLKLVDSLDLDVANRERTRLLIRVEEEKPLKEVDKTNEFDDKLAKSIRENVTKNEEGPGYDAILKKNITKKEDIRGNFEIPCKIGGIAADVLVDVAGCMYPVDFVILDIKENEKRPFILGTPFLTTAKAVIKFDKGIITLRFGKSKMSFHRMPESICKIEKGIKNDIEPIAPTMTVNRLVLEWEERIKLHQEKEMKFDQWRSKNFKNKHPVLVKVESEMKDEGEVT
ncbi:MAK10-like protein [Tanacetum coccineum]